VAPAVLVAALVAGGVLIYQVGRGTTFFYDEWNFILERRTGGLDAFLRPHGGHWSTVPVAVYRVLFALVGLRHYGAYRATLIGFHLACCVLLFMIARRRVGAMLALLPTILLIFLGSAWQDLLWPFQIGYLGSIAAGLASLLALDARTRRGDLAAAAMLVLSLASSGLGVPFALAALLELLLLRGWRRLWAALVPLLLFTAWYAAYGRGTTGAQLSNLVRVPSYLARSAIAASAGLAGVSGRWQTLIAVAGLILIGLALVVGRRITPRLAMLVSMPLVFWGLAALTRGQLDEPAASRYLYPGAVFLMLITIEALRDMHLPAWAPVVAILLVPAVVANVHLLQNGAQGLLGVSASVRAELGAVQIARQTVRPDFRPDTQLMPQVSAGPYLAAVDALGSPADPVPRIRQDSPPTRALVDDVLRRADQLQLLARTPAGSPADISIDQATGVTIVLSGRCLLATAPATGAPVAISVPAGQVSLGAVDVIAVVYIRRFADDYPDVPLGIIGPHVGEGPDTTQSIRLLPDSAPDRWHVEVVTRGSVVICASRP